MVNAGIEAELQTCSREARPSYGDGRIPIMLGGIGHRQITNEAKLAALIAWQCGKIRERYKHSPFVLLSPLEEGASLLIASVIMSRLKADLIAVLPMPPDEYEKGFTSKQSRAAFAALIKKARCIKIAPVHSGKGNSQIEPESVSDQRRARTGAIIADHAQILFAIWDGSQADGKGGAADQVSWFDRGFAPAAYSLYGDQISPLDPPEPGLRIWIDPSSLTAQEVMNLQERAKTDSRRSNIRSILYRIDKFNCDVQNHRQAIEKDGSGWSGTARKFADGVFQSSDHLSKHFAKISRYDGGIIYLLALAAVIAFNFVGTTPVAPGIYLGITVAMLLLYWRIRFRSIDSRFLEYRALAEPLRVLHFWRRAGVRRSVWVSYLSRHEGVVHWLRHAARSVEFCQDCFTPPQKASAQDIKAVKNDWVKEQRDWFETKRIPKHERRRKFFRGLWRMALGASLVLSFAMFLMTLPFLSGSSDTSLWWQFVEPYGNWWQAVLAVLAAGGLTARGYSERCGDAELAKQYASQRRIFETAYDMLNGVGQPSAEWTAEEILERLGDQALQEQGEFVWLRHARPFEMPQQ